MNKPSALQTSAILHLLALAAFARDPASWRLVAGFILTNHGVLVGATLYPRSRLLGPNITRTSAGGGHDEIALTFDDGPDPELTPRVLDLLDEYGARSSFFAIGSRAERHPEIVAETARRGHRIENHTYSHPWSFSLEGPRKQANEIDRAQEALTLSSGQEPNLFRAPAGFGNPFLQGVLSVRSLERTSWTRRAFDTVDGCPKRIVKRLTTNLTAGDILVLHDCGGATSPAHRPVVLEALPRILDTIAEKGLRSVPVRPSV